MNEETVSAGLEPTTLFRWSSTPDCFFFFQVFNKNFFKDWRKTMTEKEKEKIRDLSKCDFSEINTYFKKVLALK